jgi:hypothetical protein
MEQIPSLVQKPSCLDSWLDFCTKENKNDFKSLLELKLSKRRYIKDFKELLLKTTQR